jgi:hypothetical protein
MNLKKAKALRKALRTFFKIPQASFLPAEYAVDYYKYVDIREKPEDEPRSVPTAMRIWIVHRSPKGLYRLTKSRIAGRSPGVQRALPKTESPEAIGQSYAVQGKEDEAA